MLHHIHDYSRSVVIFLVARFFGLGMHIEFEALRRDNYILAEVSNSVWGPRRESTKREMAIEVVRADHGVPREELLLMIPSTSSTGSVQISIRIEIYLAMTFA